VPSFSEYDVLNEAWKEAERKLAALPGPKPSVSVAIPKTSYRLAFTRIGGPMRLGLLLGDTDYDDPKPILECSYDMRLAAAAAVPALLKEIQKKRAELPYRLKKAVELLNFEVAEED
jgi:hypothetical protein